MGVQLPFRRSLYATVRENKPRQKSLALCWARHDKDCHPVACEEIENRAFIAACQSRLSELTEGSTLYIPVWKPGALLYTGDSHAVQGDGEICLTAIETRMKELQIQVVLHKRKNLAWPLAETDKHWIVVGLDKDLNAAMTLAARNAIKFLAAQAKISELDAYALCSIAVSFRVTQVVDIVRGVHALIPKNIFASELRQQMKMV